MAKCAAAQLSSGLPPRRPSLVQHLFSPPPLPSLLQRLRTGWTPRHRSPAKLVRPHPLQLPVDLRASSRHSRRAWGKLVDPLERILNHLRVAGEDVQMSGLGNGTYPAQEHACTTPLTTYVEEPKWFSPIRPSCCYLSTG